jgi:hypothetical protein
MSKYLRVNTKQQTATVIIKNDGGEVGEGLEREK